MDNFTFTTITKEEYDNFESNIAFDSFLQAPEMADLLLSNHWNVDYVAVRSDNDKIVTAALLCSKNMTGGKHFEIQYGPIFAEYSLEIEHFFYQNLREFVKAHNGLELLVIPNTDYLKLGDDGQNLQKENDYFLADLSNLGYKHRDFERNYNERGESIWHYVKDLTNITDEKQLLKSFNKSGQYSVKLAQKYGIKIEPLAYDELHIFQEIAESTAERRNYSGHDLAYHQEFYKMFGEKCEFLAAKMNFFTYHENLQHQITELNNQITVLDKEIAEHDSAKKKKQRNNLVTQKTAYEKRILEVSEFAEKYGNQEIVLAVGLFIYTQGETTYLTSGSREEFKAFCAPFLIQYESMVHALQKGKTSYNFFGISGNLDPAVDGVLRYKQNFNGYITEKVGYFSYYPHPVKFKTLKLIKKILRK